MSETSHVSQRGFIVGAGFSKAASIHMPCMNELNADVLKILCSETPPIFKALPVTNDIELLLTYLAEYQPWLDRKTNLENRVLFLRLSEIIQGSLKQRQETSIAEIRSHISTHWIFKLIQFWHTQASIVISLNYDLLVELLFNQLKLIPNHARAYSELYPINLPPLVTRSGIGLIGSDNPYRTFTLSKLHGSMNWLYSGSEEFFGEQIYDAGLGSSSGRTDDGRLAIDKVPLIIPPTVHKETFFKNELIQSLWRDAWRSLQNCEEIYFLGYSLPKSDNLMKSFLQTAIKSNKIRRLIVVNTDSSVIENYKSLAPDKPNIFDFQFVGGDEPIARCVNSLL